MFWIAMNSKIIQQDIITPEEEDDAVKIKEVEGSDESLMENKMTAGKSTGNM